MRRRAHPGHATALAWAAALLAACGNYTLKVQGEECYASSECEPGLLCDFGVSPHVCSPTQTDASPIDAYVPPPPDAEPDIDAPPQPDAGQEVDAAPTVDAAPDVDAPPPADAAPPIDAEAPDAAPEIDADVADAA